MKPRHFKADVQISRTNLEQEVIIHQSFQVFCSAMMQHGPKKLPRRGGPERPPAVGNIEPEQPGKTN